MTKGAEGLHKNSEFSLNGSTPGMPESFPSVSMEEAFPKDEGPSDEE